MEFQSPPTPPPQPEPQPQIDTGRRYDIYCMGVNRKLIVYRNALFKRATSLLPGVGNRIVHHDFIEMEQGNGETVFISRGHIIKFCEPGISVVTEEVDQPQ